MDSFIWLWTVSSGGKSHIKKSRKIYFRKVSCHLSSRALRLILGSVSTRAPVDHLLGDFLSSYSNAVGKNNWSSFKNLAICCSRILHADPSPALNAPPPHWALEGQTMISPMCPNSHRPSEYSPSSSRKHPERCTELRQNMFQVVGLK